MIQGLPVMRITRCRCGISELEDLMGRLSHIAVHPPIYHARQPGFAARVAATVSRALFRLADFLRPERVCRREAHIAGYNVYGYEEWDLDHRYNRYYVGHACGRCGELV
jgi:hypothetical protein